MKKPGNQWIASRRFRWDLLVVAGLIVLTFSAWPILNRIILDRFIQQLALRANQTPDLQVEIPIRQLARLGLPAIESLVVISASTRTVPAVIARREVDQELTHWLSQAEKKPSNPLTKENANVYYSPSLSSQMSRLAGALAHHVNSMDTKGQQWAGRVSMRILLHTDRVFPGQSEQVIADCQTVLAAVPHETQAVGEMNRFEQTAAKFQRLVMRIWPSLPWRSLATTLMANLERLSSQVQQPSPEHAPVSIPDPMEVSNQRYREPQARRLALSAVDIISERGLPSQPKEQGGSSRVDNPVRRLSPSSDPANLSERSDNPLRQRNSEIAPAMSSQSKATSHGPPALGASHQVKLPSHKSREQVFDVPTPTEMAARRQQLQAMPLRELIVLLGNANDFEAALIRNIARTRGLWDVELALAAKLGATQTAERLEILQQLSLLPAKHARRWLRWLLEDKEADVRLQALAMMATTEDPQIESLARHRMLEDTDPRVIELATQIVNRR